MTTVVLAHVLPVECFFARIQKTDTHLLRIPRCQAHLVEVSSDLHRLSGFPQATGTKEASSPDWVGVEGICVLSTE